MPAQQRFKGYARREIIGRHFSTFYTEAARAAGLPARRARDRAAERPLRGGRLAGPEARQPLLGESW